MRTLPLHRALASALAALVAAGVPFARAARADGATKVLIAPARVVNGQVSDALAPKVTDVLADELHGQDGLQLVTPKVEVSAKSDDAVPPGAAAALARIEKGERAVRALKFKSGASEIEAGLQDYESFPAQVDIKKLREAYVQLAVANARGGDLDASREALEQAVRLAPDVKLGGSYPPAFVKQFSDAKRHVLAGKRGTLAFAGEGAVELDGKGVGNAPTKLDGVLEGGHFVRVTRADGSTWGVKVTVAEGESTVTIPAVARAAAVAVAVKAPELAPLEKNVIDASVLAGLQRLASDTGADLVVFGGLYHSADGVGFAPHLYSAQKKAVVALHPASFDADLVSAGTDLDKVAAEIAKDARAFPAQTEKLPAAVVAPAESKPVVVEKPKEPEDQPKIVLVTPPPRDEPKPEPKPFVETKPPEPAAGGLDQETPKPAEHVESSHAWIWAVAGGVALVGAGVGGYVLYKNQTQSVTGSAQLNFQ